MRFGKVQNLILDEGIHPIIPIVNSVKKISVRVQKTDIESQAGTKDLQVITVAVALNWHIDPAQVSNVYQQVGIANKLSTQLYCLQLLRY